MKENTEHRTVQNLGGKYFFRTFFDSQFASKASTSVSLSHEVPSEDSLPVTTESEQAMKINENSWSFQKKNLRCFEISSTCQKTTKQDLWIPLVSLRKKSGLPPAETSPVLRGWAKQCPAVHGADGHWYHCAVDRRSWPQKDRMRWPGAYLFLEKMFAQWNLFHICHLISQTKSKYSFQKKWNLGLIRW